MRVQSGAIVSSIGRQDNTTRPGHYFFFWGETVLRVSVTTSQPNEYGVVDSEYKINIRGPQQSFEFTEILNALESYSPTQTVDDSNLGMRSNSNLPNSLLRRNSV